MEERLLFGNTCKIQPVVLLLVETKNQSMFHLISTDLPLDPSLCSNKRKVEFGRVELGEGQDLTVCCFAKESFRGEAGLKQSIPKTSTSTFPPGHAGK